MTSLTRYATWATASLPSMVLNFFGMMLLTAECLKSQTHKPAGPPQSCLNHALCRTQRRERGSHEHVMKITTRPKVGFIENDEQGRLTIKEKYGDSGLET